MWSFWPGAIAFAVALASGFVNDGLLRLPGRVAGTIAGIGLAISLYSVTNGIYHALVTWEFIDLFSEASERDIQVQRRGGGLALLLIQFWPFAAVIVGGMGALIYWRIFRRSVKKVRDTE